jgi:hypothetical protein
MSTTDSINTLHCVQKWRKEPALVICFSLCSSFPYDYVHYILRHDKAFIMDALEENPNTFAYVDHSLKCDKDIVLQAIKGNHINYTKINLDLRLDKRFVLEAINVNRNAYQFVDISLRDDRAIYFAVNRIVVDLCRSDKLARLCGVHFYFSK